MERPPAPPLGLLVSATARTVSRAFDEALRAAGGSLPVWLVLLTLKTQAITTQRELAAGVGIREATLTHHLNAMERSGLLTRRRDPANRRVQIVELTDAGEARFGALREAAVAFDRRLRRGVSADEAGQLRELLARLAANVGTPEAGPPWRGLAAPHS